MQLPDGEVNHPFLKTFGQPARELACECERESDGNLAQALQLINGPTVNEKLRNPNNRLGKLLAAKKTRRRRSSTSCTSRRCRGRRSTDEAKVALAHVAKATDKRKAWEDVLWALINTRSSCSGIEQPTAVSQQRHRRSREPRDRRTDPSRLPSAATTP